MPEKNKKFITHDGGFHSDDVFAAATLALYFEKKHESFEFIRTRDEEIIKTGDIVFDVGGVYDEDKNKFDHHQKGLAPRENAIEYASFGLVWKKFGKSLLEREESWKIIEEKLVCPIDALDNGQEISKPNSSIYPYLIQDAIGSLRLTWKEDFMLENEMFQKAIELAKIFLFREIKHADAQILARENVLRDYDNTKDKRIVILSDNYPYENVLIDFKEPVFVIMQKKSNGLWCVKAVRENVKSFKNRKNFPETWGGLRDESLQNLTGVPDAVFCHKGLFLAVAKSKEGALKLAEIALGK